MVQFKKVDPNEIDNSFESGRGRISYPILKGFLETEMFIAELDQTDLPKKGPTLPGLLRLYIERHDLPIAVLPRNGKVYLMRIDIDKDGNKIEGWSEKRKKELMERRGVIMTEGDEAPEITEADLK